MNKTIFVESESYNTEYPVCIHDRRFIDCRECVEKEFLKVHKEIEKLSKKRLELYRICQKIRVQSMRDKYCK